jgi:hypothetical protein
MTPALEGLICRTAADRAKFEEACAECFATQGGKHVLTVLCAACHPLMHVPGMSDHEHGRAEVVATLWRFGAQTAALPQPTPPTT